MTDSAPKEKGPGSFFDFTTRRPVAIVMMVLGVFTFGYISLGKLPVNLLPDISYPTITVRTEYPAAAPEDVEERVSRRVHEALSVLPDLERISSVSKPGLSDVVLEFAWDTNIAYATQNVREKLDRTELPDDVETPVILRYDPTLDPVIRIGVFGSKDLAELRKIAEDDVQRRLETIDGVAAVKVRGGLEEEIRIEVDVNKLRELDIGIDAIDNRLAEENVNMAGGTIEEGDTEYLVRTLNQFRNLDEINSLVLRRDAGNAIRLGDVARISKSFKERDVITRINGLESVELQIFKEADANIVSVAEDVKKYLLGSEAQRSYAGNLESGKIDDPEKKLTEALIRKEKEKAEGKAKGDDESKKEEESGHGESSGRSRRRGPAGLEKDPEIAKLRDEVEKKLTMLSFIAAKLPEGIEVRVLSDQSLFIRDSIDEVRTSALLGGLFAILVLFIFLRNFVSTAIIALSIPISVIATFAPMFLCGTSLNIMSLGGLALGIGMLVDNSIIVLESIFRCREEGHSVREAAVRGVSEIGGAATASTLTTVAVFFPIVFVEGIAGQIFGDQALTVVFSLITSLAVALFFIPMLASRRLPEKHEGTRRRFTFKAYRNFRQALRNSVKTFKGRRLATQVLLTVLFPATTAVITTLFLLHQVMEIVGFLLVYLFIILSRITIVLGAVTFFLLRYLLWPLTKTYDLGFNLLRTVYPVTLRFMLSSRTAMLILFVGVALLFFSAFRIWDGLGKELLPQVHLGELTTSFTLSEKTRLEKTDSIVTSAQKKALDTGLVEWVSSSSGVARDEIAGVDEGEHTAKLFARIRTGRDVFADENAAKSVLREVFSRYPELTAPPRFIPPTFFSFKAPIQVEIKGSDLDEIAAAAREVVEVMHGIPGLTDVKSTVHKGRPEIIVRLDREKLSRFGLDTRFVANRISSMIKGNVPTLFQSTDRKVDILVKLDEDLVRNVEDLAALPVNSEAEAPLPLSAVADLKNQEGPGEIRRIWGQRAAVVSANLKGFDMGAVSDEIRRQVAPIREGTALNIELGGQGREMESALQNMMLAFYLAVFLVYVVMASQFESFIQPFIIIVTIPLAFVGVVFALHIFEIPLSVVVFTGVIMLAGIVVNNAIVLIDYINQLRKKGLSRPDAVVQACTVRLRPVLMTMATTVLGLLPLTGVLGKLPFADAIPFGLGLGEGTEIRAPMAVAVISGLLFSTILTFYVIPAVYSLADRSMEVLRNLAAGKRA